MGEWASGKQRQPKKATDVYAISSYKKFVVPFGLFLGYTVSTIIDNEPSHQGLPIRILLTGMMVMVGCVHACSCLLLSLSPAFRNTISQC